MNKNNTIENVPEHKKCFLMFEKCSFDVVYLDKYDQAHYHVDVLCHLFFSAANE